MTDETLRRLEAETLQRIEQDLKELRRDVTEIKSMGFDRRLSETAQSVRDVWVTLKEEQLKIRALQDAESRRVGARGMFELAAKYGPGIVSFVAFFILGALAKWVLVK